MTADASETGHLPPHKVPKPGLEMVDGQLAGRDPRKMTEAEFAELGQQRMSPMEVIRAKCLDCSAGSPQEVEEVAARSKQVADDEFPTDVRWIRSYVIAEEDGTLGSVCIYQAVSPEAIREHAQRVGMPADEIWDVADTVVIRPDPVKEAVA